MLFGSLVHSVLEILLKRLKTHNTPIDLQKLRTYTVKLVTQEVNNSSIPEITEMQVPSPEYISEMSERVFTLITDFIKSDYFENEILSQSKPERGTWRVEPVKRMEYNLRGYKVYAIADFIYTKGKYEVITDWKTGSPSGSYKNQLRVYALCESTRNGIPITDIMCSCVYLSDMSDNFTTDFSSSEGKETEEWIIEESKEMYSLLKDVPKNIPKTLDNFPMTNDLKTCKYCNFVKFCWPDTFEQIMNVE